MLAVDFLLDGVGEETWKRRCLDDASSRDRQVVLDDVTYEMQFALDTIYDRMS